MRAAPIGWRNLEDHGQNQISTIEWLLAAGTRVCSRVGQDPD